VCVLARKSVSLSVCVCVSVLICATVCVKFNLQLEATKGQAKQKKFNQFCLFCVLVGNMGKKLRTFGSFYFCQIFDLFLENS